MFTPILTRRLQPATPAGMKMISVLLLAGCVAACGGCVRVQAPDKPIEINLNVNIKQEVIVTLKKDADNLINSKPELFPQ